jgi:hypothetical protein
MFKYSDIEDAFIFVSMSPPDEHDAFLNLETGETYFVSMIGDSDELPDDIEESEKYISIPHKNELSLGKSLAFDYASVHLPDEFERVRGFFSNRGAYARYKDLLQTKGQLEDWYEFESKAIEVALREWCHENGIELK